jgi:hypothetical protein
MVNFTKGEKVLKKCIDCRERAKEWKDNNRERISLYNKMSVDKRNNEKETCLMIYAKKTNEDVWKEYKTQLEAANLLKLRTSNINKVIKGHLKTTGGYEFKIENITVPKTNIPSWEQIKTDNDFDDMVKGQPSNHRILHEEKNNIMGKCCCTCKEWKELTEFNKAESHWDKLRTDCKNCLTLWRKNNVKEISRKYSIYEKNRTLTDPIFKLVKTLRSRLNSVLNRCNIEKGFSTMELTGCELPFLKGYLEAKFTEGMTWENHGDWHIDHIKPCCSFDLTTEEEQKNCFHYTNLQPLWAKDNLSKGGKYECGGD